MVKDGEYWHGLQTTKLKKKICYLFQTVQPWRSSFKYILKGFCCSKKHIQFKARVQKPYPIWNQNGHWKSIPHFYQNGWKILSTLLTSLCSWHYQQTPCTCWRPREFSGKILQLSAAVFQNWHSSWVSSWVHVSLLCSPAATALIHWSHFLQLLSPVNPCYVFGGEELWGFVSLKTVCSSANESGFIGRASLPGTVERGKYGKSQDGDDCSAYGSLVSSSQGIIYYVKYD